MKAYPRFKCEQCGQVWNAPSTGPTSCPHCGYLYVKRVLEKKEELKNAHN